MTHPTKSHRMLAIAGVLCAFSFGVAACGGDDDGGDEHERDTADIQERLREKLSEKPSGDVGTQLEISSCLEPALDDAECRYTEAIVSKKALSSTASTS